MLNWLVIVIGNKIGEKLLFIVILFLIKCCGKCKF